ncbi:MAG: carbohydrate ABC transporter permease [Treponema bryantii]|nr:carbohydrate ABC transporter permease [Treponema bryantii]
MINKSTINKIIVYILLSIGSFIMIFPFIWMILSAFKTSQEIIAFPPKLFPSQFNFSNFVKAFQMAPFAKYFFNSVIVMIFSVICTTFTTILGAFAFSRLEFKGKEIVFAILISLMMIPFEMLIITNYTTIVKLKLYNTLPALILPFVSSIFYTYILKNFFDTVPNSIYYSARIDGASNWFYLWRVMVPLAKPSLFTIILLNALSSWNSFMWPLYITSDSRSRTLPYGLQAFTTEAGSFHELLMAASSVIVIPMIILFIFARKYIVSGVSKGGIKG